MMLNRRASVYEQYFLNRWRENLRSSAYNIPLVLQVRGPFDPVVFAAHLPEKLNSIAPSHFGLVKWDIDHWLIESKPNLIPLIDVSTPLPKQLKHEIQNFVNKPFQLDEDLPWRARIFSLRREHYIVAFCFHHAFFDGFSSDALINSLFPSNPAREMQPQTGLDIRPCTHYEGFWEEVLRDAVLTQKLDFFPNGDRQSDTLIWIAGELCDNHTSLLSHLIQSQKTTWFRLLTASWAATIASYQDEPYPSDLIFQHATNACSNPNLIGCYVSALPLRIKIERGDTIEECIQKLAHFRRSIRPFQYQPFEFSDALNLKYNIGSSPFNLAVYESPGLFSKELGEYQELRISRLLIRPQDCVHDLVLYYSHEGSSLQFRAEGRSSKCSRAILNSLVSSFKSLLINLSNRRDLRIPIQAALINSDSQSRTSLHVEIEKPTHVLEEVFAQIDRFPDRVTIETLNDTFTYKDLREQIIFFDHEIKNQLLPHCSLIALETARTIEYFSYIFALWLNGLSFVPLDPLLPQKRKEELLERAGPRALIRITDLKQRFDMRKKVLNDGEYSDWMRDVKRRVNSLDPGYLAYMMFTSGSTGTPKGVKISHSNLGHFAHAMKPYLNSEKPIKVLAHTSFSFDISFLEWLLPLTNGFPLFLVSEQERDQFPLLRRLLKARNISLLQATPTFFSLLLCEPLTLAHELCIFVGGEALCPGLARELLKFGPVHNMYGPTETTIWCSVTPITNPNSIHISNALPGTSLSVRDVEGKRLPIGKVGELVIQGPLVGAGYLNDEASNAFCKIETISSYRTGDLVREMDEDHLVYIGRVQNDNKLNGFRIDLTEVEIAFCKASSCSHAKAVIRGESPCQSLWVFTSDPKILEPTQYWIELLLEMLPQYAVPSVVVYASHFPQLISGKLDLRRLVQMSEGELISQLEASVIHPGTPDPKACIKDTLLTSLNLTEDFWTLPLSDLGLRSIDIARTCQRIHTLGFESLRIADFYRSGSLETLARQLQEPLRTDSILRGQDDMARGGKKTCVIVGAAGRFPCSNTITSFFEDLKQAHHLIFPALWKGTEHALHGGWIRDTESFDSEFFRISPRELKSLDPRQAFLLEQTWLTLEDAGYDPLSLRGKRIGVFVGASIIDSAPTRLRSDPYSLSGLSPAMLANRLSHFFDWRGPSYVIDTACSSSLIALVRGMEAINQGKCEMAVVAGVNLIFDPEFHEGLMANKMLSPHHRCATFDQQADGYVRSEAIVVVLIKSLESARRDADAIYLELLSGVENQNGKTLSYSAPSVDAQIELLSQAYKCEETPTYIELHGTGTQQGDAVEFEALRTQFRNREHPILLGSVKSVAGHAEAASGLVSMVKLIKCVEEGLLTGNLHFNHANAFLEFDAKRFRLLTGHSEIDEGPSLAPLFGVSSFGFSGSNAHVVARSVRPESRTKQESPSVLPFCFSAPSPESLRLLLSKWVVFCETTEINPKDVSWTLSFGRTHFEHRVAFIAETLKALGALIEAHLLTGASWIEKSSQETYSKYCKAFLRGEEPPKSSPLFSLGKRAHVPGMEFASSPVFPKFRSVRCSDQPNFEIRSVGPRRSARITLDVSSPLFSEHRMEGRAILPGAASISIIEQVLRDRHPHGSLSFVDVFWRRPVVLQPGNQSLILTLVLEPNASHGYHAEIMLQQQSIFQCLIDFSWKSGNANVLKPLGFNFNNPDVIYTMFRFRKMHYGPSFRRIQSMKIGGHDCETFIDAFDGVFSPYVLDAIFQSSIGVSIHERSTPILPFSLGRFALTTELRRATSFFVHVQRITRFRSNFFILDNQRNLIGSIVDFGSLPYPKSPPNTSSRELVL